MSRYTLWAPPPMHKRTPLRAGAKLSAAELKQLKKEIDAERKPEPLGCGEPVRNPRII